MNEAPRDIKLHKKSQELEIVFNSSSYRLSAEYLRTHSPSAEVKGHGPGQEILQLNKENVNIVDISVQGNYAIRISFDDGHDSGIYSWQYLKELGENKDILWKRYQEKVKSFSESEYTANLKWVNPATSPSNKK